MREFSEFNSRMELSRIARMVMSTFQASDSTNTPHAFVHSVHLVAFFYFVAINAIEQCFVEPINFSLKTSAPSVPPCEFLFHLNLCGERFLDVVLFQSLSLRTLIRQIRNRRPRIALMAGQAYMVQVTGKVT